MNSELITSIDIRVLGLDELRATIERLFHFLIVFSRLLDEHARCRSLGLAGLANLGAALYVNVRNVLILTEDGQVAQHIDGRDVGSNDNESSKA